MALNPKAGAFPLNLGSKAHQGMTIHQYFAAKAMQAILTAAWGSAINFKVIAEKAKAQADEMCKVLD